jgi:hypothetical protein
MAGSILPVLFASLAEKKRLKAEAEVAKAKAAIKNDIVTPSYDDIPATGVFINDGPNKARCLKLWDQAFEGTPLEDEKHTFKVVKTGDPELPWWLTDHTVEE